MILDGDKMRWMDAVMWCCDRLGGVHDDIVVVVVTMVILNVIVETFLSDKEKAGLTS